MKLRSILFLVMVSATTICFSQTKNEYEKRISESDFPKPAMALLENRMKDFKRVRFYEEYDGKHHSFECKFKYAGKRYSVEFSNEGVLEDIEIRIKKNELDKKVLQEIEKHLNANFTRWKFEKIQWQFPATNPESNTLKAALQLQAPKKYNYELIVATKTAGKLQKYELLFSEKGTLIQQRKVSRRSYDFLLF